MALISQLKAGWEVLKLWSLCRVNTRAMWWGQRDGGDGRAVGHSSIGVSGRDGLEMRKENILVLPH